MKFRLLSIALLLATAPAALLAATVTCPPLMAAQPVGACPTEEDLLFTFNGYCSADVRMYSKDSEVCTDYRLYRKMKNIALWEVPGTGFEAYVSCDIAAARLKAFKPTAVAVSRKGKLSQLTCSYDQEVSFTYRTREECRIENAEACKADAAACKASCE